MSDVENFPEAEALPVWVGRAVEAAQTLQTLSGGQRSKALGALAVALEAAQDEILEANTLDLEASQEMAVPDLVQEWLKLTPERLQEAVSILRALSRLADPLQQAVLPTAQPSLGQGYGQRHPLGVVAMISEAFPGLGAIATGFCLRTGNSLLLRGGSESSHSNQAIYTVLQQTLEEIGFPKDSLLLLPTEQGSSLRELLGQRSIDLIIPYGRASLVQQVAQQAAVPVLPTRIGNCYLYWSSSAGLETVRSMIQESHRGEPERVNGIEKILIQTAVSKTAIERLLQALQDQEFDLRGDAALVAEFPQLKPTEAEEWRQPYQRLPRVIALRWVEDVSAAIAWINEHSSGHADCIATAAYSESRQFAQGIRSATTYVNASPRFERLPGLSQAIALGMSNQAGPQAGRIGLDTFTRISQIILG